MPNTKDDKKTGTPDSMKSDSGHETHGQKSASGHGKDTGMKGEMDDDMTTAGGREGQFSDKNRGKDGQWSPSSSRSTDE